LSGWYRALALSAFTNHISSTSKGALGNEATG
jgi:hypothetical protein